MYLLRTWPHLNSCYVIYAVFIPSNINSRQVALTFLCFQASLLSLLMLARDWSKSHGMTTVFKDYGFEISHTTYCDDLKI